MVPPSSYLDAVVSVVEELTAADCVEHRIDVVIDDVVSAHRGQVDSLHEETHPSVTDR